MFLFCFLIAGCSTSYDNTYTEVIRERTPAELEAELLSAEMSLPLNYLTVNYSLRQNLIDETVIEGTVSNSARMATYQDVVLLISFQSETGTEIGTRQNTVYKFVQPNGSAAFKIKTYAPKYTRKIGVTVINAKPTH